MKGKFISVLLALMLALSFSLIPAVPVSAAPLSGESVTPTSATVGASTDYDIAFTTATDIPLSTGTIVITFPVAANEYDLSTVVEGDVSVTDDGSAYTYTSAVINSGAGTVTITAGGSAIAASSAVVVTIGNSHIVNPTASGDYTINIEAPSGDTGSAAVTINPDAFTKLLVLVPGQTYAPGADPGYTGSPSVATAGTGITATVRAVDDYWNLVDTVVDIVHIATTDPDDTEPSDAALEAGTEDFTVTFVTAGTQTITASDVTDGTKTSSTTPNITVNPDDHVAYLVEPVALTQEVDTAFTVTITAVDQFENPWDVDDTVLEGYTFTFSGPSNAPDGTTEPTYPSMPLDVTAFTDGVWTPSVTLVRGETVALTVEDSQATPMTGTSTTINVFKVLVLNDGWTLISTDREIDTTLSEWVGTSPVPILKYTGVSYETVTLAALRPVDALYVKTVGGGEVRITSSAMAGVSSKNLSAGWNLISSGTGADNNAGAVLSPLRYVPVGE